jgi:hypothetical protein
MSSRTALTELLQLAAIAISTDQKDENAEPDRELQGDGRQALA